MNPQTGEFHEVIEEEGQMPVVKATMKTVPQHWPIFKIGGTYDFKGIELTLEKIVGKDMFFVGEGAKELVHQTAKIKGHRFRARKFDGRYLWLRAVKGLPRAYLDR